MELEDLVTGVLAPGAEERVAESPTQIIRDNRMIQPGALAELAEKAIVAIGDDPAQSWDLVSEIVAYQISSSLSSSASSNALLLFYAESATGGDSDAIAWVRDRLETLRDYLRETEQKRRRSSAIGSFSSSLDFLVSLFGDEAEEEISRITGAKRPTVRKWIAGNSAQWRNSNKVMSVARVLFALIEEQSRDEAEVLRWFHTPLASGSSPIELWATGSWSIPTELREEIKRMGVNENGY